MPYNWSHSNEYFDCRTLRVIFLHYVIISYIMDSHSLLINDNKSRWTLMGIKICTHQSELVACLQSNNFKRLVLFKEFTQMKIHAFEITIQNYDTAIAICAF